MANPENLVRPKKGQRFGGRQKGSKNKITQAVLEGLAGSFEHLPKYTVPGTNVELEGPEAFYTRLAHENPRAYQRILDEVAKRGLPPEKHEVDVAMKWDQVIQEALDSQDTAAEQN